MNTKDPYIRLQFYYLWLTNNYNCTNLDENFDLGVPMKRLHELGEIPLSVIRNDFLCMFQWQHSLALSIASDPNCDSPAWDTELLFDEDHEQYSLLNRQYNLDALYNALMEEDIFPKKLEELIVSGMLDELPIYMDNKKMAPTYHVPLSLEDSIALQSLHENETQLRAAYQSIQKNYQKTIFVKDSYLYNHHYNALNEKLELLNHAISSNNCLSMKYQTAKGHIHSFLFRPLKISYDSNENLYSVISVRQKQIQVHRLDHILSLTPCSEKLELPDTSLLDIAPNVWGNCFTEKPEHVKIKFYPEANVWDKVKKDLASRTNGRLYEQDGFLYYEDTVYGISKFRSWIYGYGSSAIVLEPESLRLQIIDSLKYRNT